MGVKSDILIQVPKGKKHITGEAVKGIVRFTLQKDTVFKNISLSLVMKGVCQWHHPTRGKVQGTETYVGAKMYILNQEIDGKITLAAGSYENDFQIIVPENLPPSVKTSDGEIKYHLVLKFKKPEMFSTDKIFNTHIKIYPRMDSSLSDEPIGVTLDKILWEMFSSKTQADIKLQAVLDREYVIPGGQRNIAFFINNYSNVTFKIKTELVSKTVYKIPDHNIWLDKEKVISSRRVETPTIPKKSVSSMMSIIPVATELCTVRHSSIMQREYVVRVTMKLPMPHTNISADIPVFVGDIVQVNYGEAGQASAPLEDPQSHWENMYENE